MGSQRQDWFTGKNRFDWPPPYSIKKTLQLPDWLSVTSEHRTRYETYDVPWIRGQTGGQYQTPLQTVLWPETNHEPFRIEVALGCPPVRSRSGLGPEQHHGRRHRFSTTLRDLGDS